MQVDNRAGDNKNHSVMGFLGHLDGCGVFEEVQVSQS